MKVMINNIGKKIHTLVKENTPYCDKIRQETDFTYYCVFFPAVAQILVGRLDSCFLTHIKKYMTPIHGSIIGKHVQMCVYMTY